MKERIFVGEAIQHLEAEEFIRKKFSNVNISNIEIHRTPVGTRIVIHTIRPGMVIGRAGVNIELITKELEKRFQIKNPQIDVQRVENMDLDPSVIAQRIVDAIEKGVNYKKVGNFYTSKIMQAGAIGCEIVLSGKFSGERGRLARFSNGYMKKCGDSAAKLVSKAFVVATPRLGSVGITVSIMLKAVSPILNIKKKEVIEQPAVPAAEEKQGVTEEKEVAGEEEKVKEEPKEEKGETKKVSIKKEKKTPKKTAKKTIGEKKKKKIKNKKKNKGLKKIRK